MSGFYLSNYLYRQQIQFGKYILIEYQAHIRKKKKMWEEDR